MIRILVFLGAFLLSASAYGPLRALWLFWPICMIFMPNLQNVQRVGSLSITFDLLVSTSAFFMIFLGRGPKSARLRLHALDVVVLLMMLGQMASVTVNQGFLPMYLPQIPFLYYLAYMLGRLYLRNTADLPGAMGVMCKVLVFACVMVVLEGVSRTGIVYYLCRGSFRSTEIRYGIARASLGLEHPIALGCVFLMILPWALEARRWSRAGIGPRWWGHVPTIVLVSLLMTMSRGPILGAAIALVVDQFFQRPRLRVPLLVLSAVGGMTFWFAQDAIISMLTELLKFGSTDFRERIILIDGQPHVYNGTTHRSLLYLVYREPMRLAGAFGFDRNWVLHIPTDLTMFWSIDNHYILTKMTRGYVGLIMIDLLLITTIFSAGRLALKQPDHPMASLAGSISASTIGLAIVMFTVILFRESAAMLLFSAGLLASFRDLPVSHEDFTDEGFIDEGYHEEDLGDEEFDASVPSDRDP